MNKLNGQIPNQTAVLITFDMVETVEKQANGIEEKRFNKCSYRSELSPNATIKLAKTNAKTDIKRKREENGLKTNYQRARMWI